MNATSMKFALGAITLATLAACGGGGGGSTASTPTATPQSVTVPLMISDGAAEDWATIGVKVTAITLTKSDGSTVPVTLGAASVPVNLAQLDQLGDVLSNVSLTAGDTYTGATLTISANPGDVSLTVSADPESGFPDAAGSTIAASRIQIQGATGAAGAQTLAIPVTFDKPLVVPTTPGAALNLEVDLGHPAFLTNHAVAGGASIWAVNFSGPVKHKPVDDLRRVVLRHTYGAVTSISTDNLTLNLTKELPTVPVVSPETAVASTQAIAVQVDATNGSLVYDLDAKTSSTVKDFSTVAASLTAGKFVRVATRYQQDGTLVVTRLWISKDFNTVFVSPEGHVLRVNLTKNQLVLANENGKPVTIQVDDKTQFFFRTPDNALADAKAIGTGTTFLQAKQLVRGFKVHTQVVDPLASPMVAQTVDIETATYEGKISSVTNTGFIYSNRFNTAGDGYDIPLAYIDSATANGKDANGVAITGFKYWNDTFPTLVDSGTNAISDFVAATNGSVDFGGTATDAGGSAGKFYAHGVSYARWGDKASVNGWSAPWVVLTPTAIPAATVASVLSGNSFTITAAGGTKAVTVNVSTTKGSATLAYQVDRGAGKDQVTVSPEDLSSTAGLTALTNGLVVGNRIKLSAVPQADGSLKAYAISYFTGTQPQK